MTPTNELNISYIDETDMLLKISESIKIIGVFTDTSVEISYINFVLTGYDKELNFYSFEAILKTDDYITLDEKLRVIDVNDIVTGNLITKLVPMNNSIVNIYVFYKYDDNNLSHKFDYLLDVKDLTLTNMYSTVNDPINFIQPLNLFRSTMKFIDLGDSAYYMLFKLVPFIQAADMKNVDTFNTFMNLLLDQYNNIDSITDLITNNFSIDIKFYNNYGHSKNFVVGEEKTTLDKVNCKIYFKVKPVKNIDEPVLVVTLMVFIKSYIENINSNSSLSLYISNLITKIETGNKDVEYLKFLGINDYDSSIQVIDNITKDLSLLTKSEQLNFVPEYLTIDISDIFIQII